MFGIGPIELLLVAVVALLFIGPKKLPEAMKQLGKFFVHARRHTEDFRSGLQDVMWSAEAEVRTEELQKIREELQSMNPVNSVNNLLESDPSVTKHMPQNLDTGLPASDKDWSHQQSDITLGPEPPITSPDNLKKSSPNSPNK